MSHASAARHGGGSTSCDEEDASMQRAMELVGGMIVVPFTLKAAIELGLIDDLVVAEGRALTAEELAARWPAEAAAAAVDRMLRFLASHGVVRCATEAGPDGKARRKYAATPVCKWLAGGEGSIAPLGMMMLDKAFLETWYYTKDAVAEGVTPAEKAYGMPFFEFLGSNEASNTLFNQAMAGHSMVNTKKLVERFPGFDGINVLVDVGGGTGATLRMITAQHKHVRGINYDLPHVIAQAPPVEGVEHVGGSMFDYVPSGDAILLKGVLHLLGDADCVKVLKNCYKVLPAKGKVIIVEQVLPASPEPSLAARSTLQMDVVMLNNFARGKERTEQEFADLAAEAGFSGGCRVTYIFMNIWAIEFTK